MKGLPGSGGLLVFWGMKGGLTLPSSMAGGKPQGQALRVLVYSQPCPFPPATLHLQVAKAERRSTSGGAQTERLILKPSYLLFPLSIHEKILNVSFFNNRKALFTLERIKIISPCLHHFSTIVQILRMVVDCPDSVPITMGKLFFNEVG